MFKIVFGLVRVNNKRKGVNREITSIRVMSYNSQLLWLLLAYKYLSLTTEFEGRSVSYGPSLP